MQLLLNSFEALIRWGLALIVTALIAIGVVSLIMSWFWNHDDMINTYPALTLSSTEINAADMVLSDDLFGASKISESLDQVIDETQLGLLLKGVFPGRLPDQGMAIISTNTGKDGLFSAGEALVSGVTLLAVYSDRVVLLREGIKEALFLSGMGEDTSLFSPPVSSDEGISSSFQTQANQTSSNGLLQGASSHADTADDATQQLTDISLVSKIPSTVVTAYIGRFKSNPQATLLSLGLEATGNSYRVLGNSPLISKGLLPNDEIISINKQPIGNPLRDAGLENLVRESGLVQVGILRGQRRFFVNYPL